jgi:hypothetical protein
MPTHDQNYDQDLYAWTQEQAALLREGAWHELDLAHLIEEIEDVGHSQRDALARAGHRGAGAACGPRTGWPWLADYVPDPTPVAGQALTPQPQPAPHDPGGMHRRLRHR